MARMPDEATIENAYLYLLGRALVIRQEHLDRRSPGFAYNQIKYNPLGSADFVNPNFDVAYLEAWFATDERTAVELTVPEIQGRYYTAQILDEWGEVIVNINERNFPSKPFGRFALVSPGWRGDLPSAVTPIVLHSNKAKLLGRVELKGDPDGAIKLQQAFTVSALGSPIVPAPPFVTNFGNQELIGAEIFDDLDNRLLSAADVSPNAAAMQQQARAIADYLAAAPDGRAELDKLLHEQIVPKFIDFAVRKSAPYRNHWVGGGKVGTYGGDYRLRSVANYMGIWANTADEVVYFVATRDAEEAPLDGSSNYSIRFEPDNLPSAVVNSYWSVILVGVPDYRVVANELSRYNFNSYSGLQLGADGSLTIGIGPKQPPDIPVSNWLPSPPGKPFSLTFRTYVPNEKIAGWAPPPVTKA